MRNLPKRVLKKILKEINFTIDIWQKNRELKGDKNYDLDIVNRGFAERKEAIFDDSEILTRICVSYNKAKDAQRKVSSVFSPSNEWLPIYEKPLNEVMVALAKKDINTLSRIYRNFWRDSCSSGLIGLPINMKKYYFGRHISLKHKMLFTNDVIHRYKLWQSLLGNTHTIEDLYSPCIGNPYGYYIDGKFIINGSDYQHYYATDISRLIKEEESKCVVELGAGFGGMAQYLIRDNKNITYIDLDLPENAALTAYYLLKAFPDRKIRLYGEVDSMQSSIRNNEILILPSFEVHNIPTGCAGFVFNSYSLAEMSRETINTFISEFSRIISETGYFKHVNHNKNSQVIADDFGVNPLQFNLLYKIPALWNMGRNSQMDEYEYLYRKVKEYK